MYLSYDNIISECGHNYVQFVNDIVPNKCLRRKRRRLRRTIIHRAQIRLIIRHDTINKTCITREDRWLTARVPNAIAVCRYHLLGPRYTPASSLRVAIVIATLRRRADGDDGVPLDGVVVVGTCCVYGVITL